MLANPRTMRRQCQVAKDHGSICVLLEVTERRTGSSSTPSTVGTKKAQDAAEKKMKKEQEALVKKEKKEQEVLAKKAQAEAEKQVKKEQKEQEVQAKKDKKALEDQAKKEQKNAAVAADGNTSVELSVKSDINIDEKLEVIKKNTDSRIILMREREVIMWLCGDLSFLPKINKKNKTTDDPQYKVLEEIGRAHV